MTRMGNGYQIKNRRVSTTTVAAMFICDECNFPSLGIAVDGTLATKGTNAIDDSSLVRWYPVSPEGRDFHDVPTHISNAADEAYRCRSIGADRAALILARAVIEAICKDRGAKGSNLEKRIDALRDADDIRKATAAMAHEIRHLGNEMAHGDFLEAGDEITGEEADEVLHLMSRVLDEVYQQPAAQERVTAARLARKGPVE